MASQAEWKAQRIANGYCTTCLKHKLDPDRPRGWGDKTCAHCKDRQAGLRKSRLEPGYVPGTPGRPKGSPPTRGRPETTVAAHDRRLYRCPHCHLLKPCAPCPRDVRNVETHRADNNKVA